MDRRMTTEQGQTVWTVLMLIDLGVAFYRHTPHWMMVVGGIVFVILMAIAVRWVLRQPES